MNGAYGQFTDTEKWLKEQHIEELYENFDVEYYEQARRMVTDPMSLLHDHQSDPTAVSSMDRPPRQARHSYLSFRH